MQNIGKRPTSLQNTKACAHRSTVVDKAAAGDGGVSSPGIMRKYCADFQHLHLIPFRLSLSPALCIPIFSPRPSHSHPHILILFQIPYSHGNPMRMTHFMQRETQLRAESRSEQRGNIHKWAISIAMQCFAHRTFFHSDSSKGLNAGQHCAKGLEKPLANMRND